MGVASLRTSRSVAHVVEHDLAGPLAVAAVGGAALVDEGPPALLVPDDEVAVLVRLRPHAVGRDQDRLADAVPPPEGDVLRLRPRGRQLGVGDDEELEDQVGAVAVGHAHQGRALPAGQRDVDRPGRHRLDEAEAVDLEGARAVDRPVHRVELDEAEAVGADHRPDGDQVTALPPVVGEDAVETAVANLLLLRDHGQDAVAGASHQVHLLAPLDLGLTQTPRLLVLLHRGRVVVLGGGLRLLGVVAVVGVGQRRLQGRDPAVLLGGALAERDQLGVLLVDVVVRGLRLSGLVVGGPRAGDVLRRGVLARDVARHTAATEGGGRDEHEGEPRLSQVLHRSSPVEVVG